MIFTMSKIKIKFLNSCLILLYFIFFVRFNYVFAQFCILGKYALRSKEIMARTLFFHTLEQMEQLNIIKNNSNVNEVRMDHEQ
jgi:hypothetical protein